MSDAADREELGRLARRVGLAPDADAAGALAREVAGVVARLAVLEEAGDGTPSGTPADAPVDGTEDAATPSEPDPLRRPPSEWAPDVRDGFFVVPPVPGM